MLKLLTGINSRGPCLVGKLVLGFSPVISIRIRMEADANPDPHYGKPPESEFACRRQKLPKIWSQKSLKLQFKIKHLLFKFKVSFFNIISVKSNKIQLIKCNILHVNFEL